MCQCVLERSVRGKAFRLLVEEGNVVLLVAERRYRDFEISSADGSRLATLHRARRGAFVLRRSSPSAADPELAAILLGDREVANAPSRPRLNHMRLAAAKPRPTLAELMDRAAIGAGACGGSDGGSGGGDSVCLSLPMGSPQYTRMLGRPAGELLGALAEPAPQPSPPWLLLLESRLPAWDEHNQLLTLDYPPGRANLASVQNFQLMPATPGRAVDVSDGGEPSAAVEPEDAAFTAALVHGLMSETETLESFSLDVRHPLSPLLAFAACLAAQDWE